MVLDEDGSYQCADRTIARCQKRDFVDRACCRRFICRRLQRFSRALREGHDVALGSCMLIWWGNKKTFAMVRVYKMYSDEGKLIYSQKFNKKSRKQQLKGKCLFDSQDAICKDWEATLDNDLDIYITAPLRGLYYNYYIIIIRIVIILIIIKVIVIIIISIFFPASKYNDNNNDTIIILLYSYS